MGATDWEKVAPGRYALSYLGHTLEVILNPDFPALDNRRYLAVVDHKPLEPKSWLNGAKTAAITHVQKVGRLRSANEAFNGAVAEVLDDIMGEMLDQSEPETDQSEVAEDVLVQQLPELVQFEPEPVPEPVQVTVDDTGRFAITGRITDADKVRAYAAIKSVVELLREHAEVECAITLPSVLKL
jgi:hypothetical protein